MKRVTLLFLLLLAFALIPPFAIAQTRDEVLRQYQELIRQIQNNNEKYLGDLSSNPYAPNSTSNKFGRYGSPYSPDSVTNPYSQYGNRYSPNGVANPYATDPSTPRILGSDGKYLGRLSSNPYSPDSVSNPFGRYGSPFSPDSVNNSFGKYGSPFSPYSATNPYAISPPKIVAPSPYPTYRAPQSPLLPPLPELPKLPDYP